MAQVTMDIAELDKLRAEIEKSKLDFKSKEKELNELEKEVALVKADKRVVIKKELFFSDGYNLKISHVGDFINEIKTTVNDWRIPSSNYTSTRYPSSVELLVSSNDRNVQITPVSGLKNSKSTTEFVNFEDVKKDLKVELDKDYKDRLFESEVLKNNFESRIDSIKVDYKSREEKLVREHKEEEDFLNKHIKDLSDKYDNLLLNRKEKTVIQGYEEAISDLQKQLENEMNKKWYNKLFGI